MGHGSVGRVHKMGGFCTAETADLCSITRGSLPNGSAGREVKESCAILRYWLAGMDSNISPRDNIKNTRTCYIRLLQIARVAIL